MTARASQKLHVPSQPLLSLHEVLPSPLRIYRAAAGSWIGEEPKQVGLFVRPVLAETPADERQLCALNQAAKDGHPVYKTTRARLCLLSGSTTANCSAKLKMIRRESRPRVCSCQRTLGACWWSLDRTPLRPPSK